MRKNLLTTVIVVFTMFCLPAKNFGQYLNLGKVETCSIFSVNGAVTNTGTSTFNGDVGAQIGSINNFSASTSADYTVHSTDAFTAQAKIDLLNVYVLLNNIPVTFTNHAPAFTDETVPSGVYLVGGAGSISGTVTLDGNLPAGKGGSGSNAIFIFKFQGAFSAAVNSKIVLTNGARASNIFWIAEGAISAGTGCAINGTLIAHPGAVTLGNGSSINGRMLSTTGAINFGAGDARLPAGTNTIPISCASTCFSSILGSAANFTLFTSEGALSNTGISGVIGDIGSNTAGGVSGFDASIVIGTVHVKNSVTEQAKTDLAAAYVKLMDMVAKGNSNIVHDGAYGNGETLAPGIYTTAAAGSILGVLTLDGGGDPTSTFIFKIGGAFSIAAQSRVILINGARRCNIFWTAEGAITMETFTFMKGNMISHGGAIAMGGQGFLEGRMFTTAGACSFNTATTYISNALCGPSNDPFPPKVLPIQLTSFTGNCYKQSIIFKWATASEYNNKSFSVERSDDGVNWKFVGSVAGSHNSDVAHNYSLVDNLPSAFNTSMYRLKQTDTDNNYKYSNIISVTKCGSNENENVSFSPNPSTGQFSFNFSGDVSQVSSTEIFNVQGLKVYHSNGFQSKINLTNQAAGIYLVKIKLNSKIITRKIVVAK